MARATVSSCISKSQRVSIQRVACASAIGTTIEWYDFIVYGTAAALVFPKLFFPNFSAFAGTLASFGTFAVGFFARPVGGLVFGHFGDRVGRKSMLVTTLILMGTATFSAGLLPTFKEWGILAPILLVVLRSLQGFAVGGEWGGATLMTVEHAPDESRNFYASWPQLGVPLGLMMSTAVFGAFSSITNEHFFSWGWRIPFLLSAGLIVIGLFIRLRLAESPAFLEIKERGIESKLPLIELLRDYPMATLLAVGIPLLGITEFYVVNTFTLSYVTGRLGLPRNVAFIGMLLGSVISIVGIIVFAWIADRIGKGPLAIWSAGSEILIAYAFFWFLNTRQPLMIWIAMIAWNIAAAAVYAVTGIFLADLFETRVRYSGISFGYQMAGVLGGAPTPIICAALLEWGRGASWPIATYLATLASITFIAVCVAAARCTARPVTELKIQPDEA